MKFNPENFKQQLVITWVGKVYLLMFVASVIAVWFTQTDNQFYLALAASVVGTIGTLKNIFLVVTLKRDSDES